MSIQISYLTMNRRHFLRTLGCLTGAVASLPLLHQVRASSPAQEHFRVLIIGGGLAGLCAAYELEKRGHECVILEAERKHIGGRARTIRFHHDLYGEAGAMRIPKAHDLTRHYVTELNLRLRPFVSDNPQAYAIARGRKVRVGDIATLASNYALAPDERGKTPSSLWDESIVERLNALSELEKQDLFAVQPGTMVIRDLDQKSLLKVWREAGLSEEAIEYLAITSALEQFAFTAVTEHMREQIHGIWRDGFDEIVGGTDLLPAAFAQRLLAKPRMSCEVFRLEQNGRAGPVAAIYRRGAHVEREEGDFLLCTLPFSVLERIEIVPAVSPEKKRAIRELHYDSSVKTLVVARQRFWETNDNIYGGGTVTDLITGSTYYPSDNAVARDKAVSHGPGVLLASYTWGDQARRQSSLGSATRQKLVIDQASTFHPELAQPGMVQQMATWSWERHPWSSGAYAFFQPGQHTTLYADMIRPEGRLFIAGEHASLNHSWMQGALESALRAVQEILTAAQGNPIRKRSTNRSHTNGARRKP